MKTLFALFGACTISLLSACSPLSTKHYSYTLSDSESAAINTLFANTTPYCLGRYTFEYPNALSQTVSSIIKIDEMTIESQPIYLPAFKQRIELKETEFKNKRVSDPKDAPFLKEIIRLDNGVIFARNLDSSTPDFARILEAHIYINGIAFMITSEFDDVSDDRYKTDQLVYKRHNQPLNNKPQKLAALQSLISRLHARPNGEIPSQKGVCIPNAWIADDGQSHKEKLSMVFENNQFNFSVIVDNRAPSEDQSMLERSSEILPTILQFGITTMRKGTLNYNDIPAEQWLMLDLEQDLDKENIKYKRYRFQYYANETKVDYQHPLISILLGNSTKDVTDYSDEQMVEIWDRVLRSFKLRPNAY